MLNEKDVFNSPLETPEIIKKQILSAMEYGIGGLPEDAIAVLKARSFYIIPSVLAQFTRTSVEEVIETPIEETKDQIIEKLVALGLVEGEHFKKIDKKASLLELLEMSKGQEGEENN